VTRSAKFPERTSGELVANTRVAAQANLNAASKWTSGECRPSCQVGKAGAAEEEKMRATEVDSPGWQG